MYNNYKKSVSILLILLGVIIILYTSTVNNICTKEYLEFSKQNKNLENLKICVKEHDVDAAIFLSELYAKGDSVERNHQKAIEIIKKFADSNHNLAIIQLANLYSCYLHQQQYYDLVKAESLYKKAIDNNDDHAREAEFALAQFYARNALASPNIKNIDLYLKWLNKIANKGNIKAIHLLASVYQEGEYVQQSYTKSLEWLQKAVEIDKSDVMAYRTIGNYYANGYLGLPNYEEAKKWFEIAANKGDELSAKFLKTNPKPFSLEITKATIADFQKIFNSYKKSKYPNYYNGGATYFVDSKYLPLKGVKDDAVFVFGKNNVLEAVLIVFDKDQYAEIYNYLNKKYTPMFEETTHLFIKGFSEIFLKDELYYFERGITKTYNPNFCTLIYQSRAFSSSVFNKDNLLRKKDEDIKRNRMNNL